MCVQGNFLFIYLFFERCDEPLSSPGISKSISEGIIEEEEEDEEDGESNHKRKKDDDQEVTVHYQFLAVFISAVLCC